MAVQIGIQQELTDAAEYAVASTEYNALPPVSTPEGRAQRETFARYRLLPLTGEWPEELVMEPADSSSETIVVPELLMVPEGEPIPLDFLEGDIPAQEEEPVAPEPLEPEYQRPKLNGLASILALCGSRGANLTRTAEEQAQAIRDAEKVPEPPQTPTREPQRPFPAVTSETTESKVYTSANTIRQTEKREVRSYSGVNRGTNPRDLSGLWDTDED